MFGSSPAHRICPRVCIGSSEDPTLGKSIKRRGRRDRRRSGPKDFHGSQESGKIQVEKDRPDPISGEKRGEYTENIWRKWVVGRTETEKGRVLRKERERREAAKARKSLR